jgi:hypothetical protein
MSRRVTAVTAERPQQEFEQVLWANSGMHKHQHADPEAHIPAPTLHSLLERSTSHLGHTGW